MKLKLQNPRLKSGRSINNLQFIYLPTFLSKLLILDGNAIFHRAFHALPPMTAPDGQPTNAVFGFASMLLNLINQQKPDYLIATFDRKEKTFRHEAYKEYKATRVSAPDDFYIQIPCLQEFVKESNIEKYDLAGYEADDMIGTLAKQAKEEANIQTIIVTGDRDCLQLIDDRTAVLILKQGITKTHLFDAEEVKKVYGLTPQQLIDFKAFTGDSSDNLKGVPGIGPKTATDLLQKYQNLEKVYEHLNELKQGTAEKLRIGRDSALETHFLGTIVLNAPIKLELEKSAIKNLNLAGMEKFFQKMIFFSLIGRLKKMDFKNKDSTPEQMSMFL